MRKYVTKNVKHTNSKTLRAWRGRFGGKLIFPQSCVKPITVSSFISSPHGFISPIHSISIQQQQSPKKQTKQSRPGPATRGRPQRAAAQARWPPARLVGCYCLRPSAEPGRPSSLGLWRRERGPDPGTPGRGAWAGAVATPPSVRDSEWSRAWFLLLLADCP